MAPLIRRRTPCAAGCASGCSTARTPAPTGSRIADGRSMFVVAQRRRPAGRARRGGRAADLFRASATRSWSMPATAPPFDLVTLPVKQMGMSLPPFDEPLSILTIVPDGAEGKGRLPDALAELPPLVKDLPPVSQALVMGMRLDAEGMGLMKKAGLMEMDDVGQDGPGRGRAGREAHHRGAGPAAGAAARREHGERRTLRDGRRAVRRGDRPGPALAASRRARTACCIPCTSTAASSASSR